LKCEMYDCSVFPTYFILQSGLINWHVSLSLYLYLHLYLYLCLYLFFIYIYFCICICIYIYICVCTCICIYIYMYIYICICIYICIYICICIYIYFLLIFIFVFIFIFTFVFIFIFVFVRVFVFIFMFVFVFTFTFIFVFIFIFIFVIIFIFIFVFVFVFILYLHVYLYLYLYLYSYLYLYLYLYLSDLCFYLSLQHFNSCRRLVETKRHSSLFLHWFGSKFLVVTAAFTPCIHRRTGEIKYPGWTKTSPAARQFDIDLSRARGRKPWPKITWSSRLGVDAACQLLAITKKQEMLKANTKPRKSDGDRRLKPRNRTLKFGTYVFM